MDEFALFKGHLYDSGALDVDTRRVLWIGEGRSRAAISSFFEELGPQGCAQIEAVAMDIHTGFDLEVRQHCPQARVVYDLFHVVTKYGREVIDRVPAPVKKATSLSASSRAEACPIDAIVLISYRVIRD